MDGSRYITTKLINMNIHATEVPDFVPLGSWFSAAISEFK